MKFTVLSRHGARMHSMDPNIDDCIIVSIYSAGDVPNKFFSNEHIKAILPVCFDDVEDGEPNCITKEDAEMILRFINHQISSKRFDRIIVHCDAGISRSAGVCAALMLILNGDDMAIFNDGRFCPNMSCYKSILNAFFGGYDSAIVDEKEFASISAWRRENEMDI